MSIHYELSHMYTHIHIHTYNHIVKYVYISSVRYELIIII